MSLEALLAEIERVLDRPLTPAEGAAVRARYPHGAERVLVPVLLARWFTPMTHVEAAIHVCNQLGRALTKGEFQRLRSWYPQGVPGWQVDALAEKIKRPRPDLRLVK